MDKLSIATKHFAHYLYHQCKKHDDINVAIGYEKAYTAIAKSIETHLSNDERFNNIYCQPLDNNPDNLYQHCEKSDIGLFLFDHYTRNNLTPDYPESIKPFVTWFQDNLEKTIVLTDLAHHFEKIYSIDPHKIAENNKQLIKIAEQSEKLIIRNKLGTDIEINLKNADKWTNSDGTNLGEIIPSEIATYSNTINGELVFTGSILCMIPIASKHGKITDPIHFTIESGQIKKFHTENEALKEDLTEFFSYHQNHRTIEEIGIGTNEGINELYGINASFEEKHCGLHFGLGGREQGSFHMDIMLDDATLYFDDRAIIREKQILLDD